MLNIYNTNKLKSITTDSIINDACISEAQWLRYLKDLSPLEEQRTIDRHLDNCPFCSDALEGALAVSVIDYETALNNNLLGKTNLQFMKLTTQLAQLPQIIQSWKFAAIAAGIIGTSAIGYQFFSPSNQVNTIAVVGTNDPQSSTDVLSQNVATTTEIAPTIKPIVDTKTLTKDVAVLAQTNEIVQNVVVAPQNDATIVKASETQAQVATSTEKTEEIITKPTKLPVTVTQSTNNTSEVAKPVVEKKTQEVAVPVEAKKPDDNVKGDFFVGHQMFQQKKFGESIPLLENAVNKAKLDNTEQNLAYWDLANAHIKKSNYAAAKKYCKLLIEGQSYYESKARDLLKTIEKK